LTPAERTTRINVATERRRRRGVPGRGVGAALLSSLRAALLSSLRAELPRCSLSVDRRNPAMRLDERHGFADVHREGNSLLVLHVRPDPAAAATAR